MLRSDFDDLRATALVPGPDGRPAGRLVAAGLRPSARADAAPERARARRDRVRQRLLPVSAVRAVALGDADRPAGVRHRRLRQRGRAGGDRADAGARAPGPRVPHGGGRQDALRRARPAAWLRAPADGGHLSGRRRLDAGLGASAGPAAALVPHDGERARPGRVRGGDADRLRRGGLLSRGPQALRHRPPPARSAVPAVRLVHQSPRSVGDPQAPLAALPALGDPRSGGAVAAACSRPTRTAGGCGRCAASTRRR